MSIFQGIPIHEAGIVPGIPLPPFLIIKKQQKIRVGKYAATWKIIKKTTLPDHGIHRCVRQSRLRQPMLIIVNLQDTWIDRNCIDLPCRNTRTHIPPNDKKLENHLLKHTGRVGTCSFPGGYGFQSFLFLFAKLLEGCIAKVANDTSNVKMPLFPPRLPIWTNFWRWRQKQRSGFGHDTVVMVWLINQPH